MSECPTLYLRGETSTGSLMRAVFPRWRWAMTCQPAARVGSGRGILTMQKSELDILGGGANGNAMTMHYSHQCFFGVTGPRVKVDHIAHHTCHSIIRECLQEWVSSDDFIREYGYWISAWSAKSRNSLKAPTRWRMVSSGTSGPYERSRAISDSMLGLSMAWQLKSAQPRKNPNEKTPTLHFKVNKAMNPQNITQGTEEVVAKEGKAWTVGEHNHAEVWVGDDDVWCL
ncbi:hypothetical protein E2C01_024940 [Portunus trituberculatus]|uniref:Uncharacterized protein n=1 Tax=Portunus trituberculatus TaxID=210409 RepID=A0A5B7EEN4_PORTR|nr:hypothetical protein [Portunus trituberculatus]